MLFIRVASLTWEGMQVLSAQQDVLKLENLKEKKKPQKLFKYLSKCLEPGLFSLSKKSLKADLIAACMYFPELNLFLFCFCCFGNYPLETAKEGV